MKDFKHFIRDTIDKVDRIPSIEEMKSLVGRNMFILYDDPNGYKIVEFALKGKSLGLFLAKHKTISLLLQWKDGEKIAISYMNANKGICDCHFYRGYDEHVILLKIVDLNE